MFARALKLYRLSVMELFHRLRHDLAHEIVVLIASLVVFATFLYVFDDFLNVQVSSLSVSMRAFFAKVTAVIVLGLASILAGLRIRRARFDERGVLPMARALGENPSVMRRFAVLDGIGKLAAIHGAAWLLTVKYLLYMPWSVALPIELGLLTLSLGITGLRPPPQERGQAKASGATLTLKARTPVQTLYEWRLKQILQRHRLCRVSLCVALAFALLLAYAALSRAPDFVLALAGLAAGYMVALCLCFQLAEDLRHAWTERGAGISHEMFLAAYERLGWTMGGSAGLVAALICGLRGISADFHAADLKLALSTGLVTALPAIMTPWLMLQIEGRRAGVNAILVLITALFVGTAVYAHWLSLLLPPLLRYYALNAQAGRYYRA